MLAPESCPCLFPRRLEGSLVQLLTGAPDWRGQWAGAGDGLLAGAGLRGWISVERQVGSGTRFVIDVPEVLEEQVSGKG